MKSLCVFCGSRKGHDPRFEEIARQVGRSLARRGVRLVYGAGNIGLMGAMADACLQAGGRVLGVIPDFLKEKEVCHSGLTELIVTATMHQRKEIMAARSDAFLVLPGGFGTLDEFFEILTWRQLKLHDKPIGILDVAGFYHLLLRHVEHIEQSGFYRNDRPLFISSDDLEPLLDALLYDGTR